MADSNTYRGRTLRAVGVVAAVVVVAVREVGAGVIKVVVRDGVE